MKDRRDLPFCLQEHAALEAIQQRWTGRERMTAIAVYTAMTLAASKKHREGGRDGFPATPDEIAALCGSKGTTVNVYAKALEELGLLHRERQHDDRGRDKPSIWSLRTPENRVVPKRTPSPPVEDATRGELPDSGDTEEDHRGASANLVGDPPPTTRAQENGLQETRTSEPSSSSPSGEDEGSAGSGGEVSSSDRAQVVVDRWSLRESALRVKREETARFALPMLREIASAHRWGRAERASEPTLEGVLAAIERYPTHHHMEALRDLDFWATHGAGRGKPIVSIEQLWLEFVRKAQHVENSLTPPTPDPDESWPEWVRVNFPDWPEDSDHFGIAVVQAEWAAMANVQPTAQAVREIVERRYGAYRAAA